VSTWITVRALPRQSWDEEVAKRIGENVFCDRWDPLAEKHGVPTCSGWCEVEVAVRSSDFVGKTSITMRLCREHAGYIARQLLEVIEMADAADVLRWKGDHES